MDEAPLTVEPLGAHHDRASFSCGEPSLDRYIRRQASQDAKRRVARVFVAHAHLPGRVAGYYTLSAASFEKDDLPAEVARRLPHYPVPAAVIGRLVVGLRSQGNGLGEVLLLDAIRRVVRAGDTIGVYAVVVDALHPRASAFYERYGFASFPSRPLRLYLPLRTFEQLKL
ncbi:MAG: GNAT family N-acetyltransferase [Rhodobacteraceae bacterium]|nr:GNAT family N-acetyltransferase [Paracoccaceae bacterium]MCY4327805.1 GNAT family N-acetyltransferase [Paracoccaceae bacterium]